MLRYGFAVFFVGIMAVAASHTRTSAADDPVTFSKHVLPILQKNCQSCHRPGQMAPMSLVSYRDARPWARSMKAKVESRQMPPWFADPAHGPFANDRSLSQKDIETIAKWADSGATEGDPKDAPAPVNWPADGWQIKPDVIVRGPEFRVPARTKNDVVEWITYLIPSGFTKDTWITSLEIKPSVLEVTHHICFTFVAHRPDAKYYVPNWSESDRDDEGVAIGGGNPPARQAVGGRSGPGRQPGADVGGGFNCFVPGRDADDYRKFNAGKLIPAGTDISIQVHYTPNGQEIVDRPLIGFTVADKPPAKRWMSYGIVGGGPDFAIPPNEPNYKSPPFDLTFTADVELVEFMPHMHVRGKSMTYHLVYPDGRDQIVLSVPKYDFNWQLLYQPAKTIRVPKGTRMYVEAYYDNSRANRHNPNPERTVHLGRMTWEEMMAPFFGVLIDANVDPNQVIRLGRFAAIGDGA
ncbi:MAG TPA: cytochrome c [Vicinamibacterales bacterium]|nr:cytochrome c [Vicinamibacterales bacterium]